MPKLKTHKGAKARIHITGTGKLMRRKRMSSHLRRKKPTKVTRKYSDKLNVDQKDVHRLSRLLPYG
ncbi:MAG: 50S ribosomal protein L35 [SAR202 cluster bacterium Io17-Chloro-G9]|nr:MAG: 50S ribosomal protein L35 [SAR202 cluster bacterium Io17-Chloro-G9]